MEIAYCVAVCWLCFCAGIALACIGIAGGIYLDERERCLRDQREKNLCCRVSCEQRVKRYSEYHF